MQTGFLIEDFFPRHGVRYIAMNDGIDTMRDNNDIAPFKNILNEMYSKDISKKVHSSYLLKGRKKLADEIRLAYDARQWVEAIQEYADITELDTATLNRLIKEIVVHEHIDSDKTRHISIEIHFNLKPIPEVEQVTA